MPRKSSPTPRYCRQKEKARPDRAYTMIDGKRVQLGDYGSPQSYERYSKAVNKPAELEPAKPAPTAVTVSMLMAQYLEHAIERYGGEKAPEVVHMKLAMKVLRRTHGSALAREFGPKAYQAMRRAMIENDWSRSYTSDQCQRIKRMISWGVAEEILPPSARHALDAVPPLAMGEFGVRETDPVKPADDAMIEAVENEMSETVRDMVRVMRFTGMRSGELCQLSAEFIDRKNDVWLFTPPRHKTRRHGKQRIIAIGPKAQAVLAKHLFHSPCFAYTTASFRRAITRACDRAFPLPKEIKDNSAKAQAWRTRHRFTPHMLRHAAATAIREQCGLDFAQAALGHARADVTQIYAAVNRQKAIEAALKIG